MCPLCGSKAGRHRDVPDPTMLVCEGCDELLYERELVTEVTLLSMIWYMASNYLLDSPDYQRLLDNI